MMLTFRPLLILAVLASPALAQVPEGGHDLASNALAFVTAEAPPTNGSVSVVTLENEPFEQALQVASLIEGNDWDYQVYIRSKAPVKEGDILLAVFQARTVKVPPMRGGSYVKASIEFPDWWMLPEKEQEGHAPLLQSLMVSSESHWQTYAFPARATRDFEPDGLWLALRAGVQQQTVEFADIRLLNFGPDIRIEELPRSRITYPGRDPQAPWRTAASERIENLRTREMEVLVTDASGNPLPGAKVEVELERHAFEFGVSFHARKLFEDFNPDYQHYRDMVAKNFHGGSFVNALKWQAWCGDWAQEGFNRDLALEALRWAQSENLPIRGHNMVWPRKMSIASNLLHLVEAENPDCRAVQQTIFDHIKDVGEATWFWVKEWDLLNEPIPCRDVQDLCGDQVMTEWFMKAREFFPDMRLAINEYGILSSVTDGAKVGQYEKLIEQLLHEGAPIDVLGMQGHFKAKEGIPSPDRILQLLDRFSRFGKSIRVTEFDVQSQDPELVRDVYRDVYTVMFSHPNVTGVQVWEWEEVYNEDGTLTPAGEMHRDLVWNKWFTKETGQTGENGILPLRGYLGTYRVSASLEGRQAVSSVILDRGENPMRVTVALDLP